MVITRSINSFLINNLDIQNSISTISIHNYLKKFNQKHGESIYKSTINNKKYTKKSDLYILGIKENPTLWKSIYDYKKIKAPNCPRKKPRIGKMYQVDVDNI